MRWVIRLALTLTVLGLGCMPSEAVAAAPRIYSPAEVVDLAVSSDQDSVDVVLEGEAIGEALSAPNGMRWVTLRGDDVSVGVVVRRVDAESIPLFGEYGKRGSTVRVEGTVQRACAEHGGDLDVHAETFTVLDEGESIPAVIHPAKPGVALAGLVIMAALWMHYRRLRGRLR